MIRAGTWAPPSSPSTWPAGPKPHIERAFAALGQLFCQFVSGYLGSNPDRRGRGIDGKPLWSMPELQELLDEWIVGRFTDRRTVSTYPDLRLLIGYMSAMESGGKLPSFFSACRMEFRLPVRLSREPVASFGHASACLAAAGAAARQAGWGQK